MKNLLNIGNSITIFFFILLIASIVVIFSFNQNNNYSYDSYNNIAKLEINNFILYQISDKDLLLKLKALNAKQYDTFEEFSKVSIDRYVNNKLDTIYAYNAIKKNDILLFDNGVQDTRDEYTFYTKEGIYYIKDNVLKGKNAFEINGKEHKITGNNIFYDAKSGIIEAYDIDAKFRIDQ